MSIHQNNNYKLKHKKALFPQKIQGHKDEVGKGVIKVSCILLSLITAHLIIILIYTFICLLIKIVHQEVKEWNHSELYQLFRCQNELTRPSMIQAHSTHFCGSLGLNLSITCCVGPNFDFKVDCPNKLLLL